MVQATIDYIAPMAERPRYYQYDPPPGTPRRNTQPDRRTVDVRDARTIRTTLDADGFVLATLATAAGHLDDADTVRRVYYPEVEALVKAVTGAPRVVAFDHNLRSATRVERAESGLQPPVRRAHNDYTERSGPQRVRDLLPAEADALLRHRFAVINVWKPIRGPVESAPLAVCAAPTIGAEDLVATDLVYRDRTGEIYSLVFSPAHRWYYFPHMRPDEVMLLKCYDSDRRRARFTAHSAFDDPTAPADAPPRESIEVRTLAFF